MKNEQLKKDIMKLALAESATECTIVCGTLFAKFDVSIHEQMANNLKTTLQTFFDNRKNVSKAIDIFIKNLNSFKKDINSKNNKSILKKLIQTKKVRSKIIKLKQDINKPDFGRD